MRIETLRFTNLRRFDQAELTLGAGTNLILGANGAGKTTILEAAYVLSHGRSFRRASREALARLGSDGFQVFARIVDRHGAATRLGLERRPGSWIGRLDERPLARLSELFAACAVCCFEPGSHELITGAADERRAFLDWGVFHVEQAFLDTWRRYQRALRQRNVLLRAQAPDPDFDPWEAELARSGEALTLLRHNEAAALGAGFAAIAARLLPELGPGQLVFEPGWDTDAAGGLQAILAHRRDRDRARLSTSKGPHRADWRPAFEHAPDRAHLSRGQEKLAALALVLSQARRIHAARAEWPVIALDDLPSELDFAHQRLVLGELRDVPAQVLITGTEATEPMREARAETRVFHVEQGQIRG